MANMKFRMISLLFALLMSMGFAHATSSSPPVPPGDAGTLRIGTISQGRLKVDPNPPFDTFAIYFDFNGSQLSSSKGGNSPSSASGAKDLAFQFASLRHNYGMSGYPADTRARDRIAIIGYSDCLGGARNNKRVALGRARNVRDYLLSQGTDFLNGVSADRISISFRLARKPTEFRCLSMPRARQAQCLWLDRKVEISYFRVNVAPRSDNAKQKEKG